MNKPLIVLITLLITNYITAQNTPGLSEINKEDLIKNVDILSSPGFDGRLPGSEGYNKAAQFAANKFSELGLKPSGDKNYFQFLNVEHNEIDTPVIFKAIIEKDTINYQLRKDFVLRGFTGSNSFTLPVVFCGYGISRPDLNYDDYSEINVRNKIVMVFSKIQNGKMKIKNGEQTIHVKNLLLPKNMGQKEYYLYRFLMMKNRNS